MIGRETVDVSSLTLVKNNGPAGSAKVSIPQMRVGMAPGSLSNVALSWAGKALPFQYTSVIDSTPGSIAQPSDLVATGAMQNLGTYALRVNYRVPIGKSGFDHKQRLAIYDVGSPVPIGTLMVTYSYAPGVVFHEPEAGPNLGWQIGLKGAFVKVSNYDGKAGLSYCAFYPGGFGG